MNTEPHVRLQCVECDSGFDAPRSTVERVCPRCLSKTQSVGDVLRDLGVGYKSKTCGKCGNSFLYTDLFKHAEQYVTICPDCADAQAKEETRLALQRSAPSDNSKEGWAKLFPFETATEVHKLPQPSKLHEAMRFNFSTGRGIVLFGVSGTGKSRIVWEVARREYFAGRSVRAIDSGFGYHYAAMFEKSAAWVDQWLKQMIASDILVMDDVFKVKITESIDQAIFYITDKRYEQRKPIFWTLNDTGESLLSRLGADRGPALLRRIRETCQDIKF